MILLKDLSSLEEYIYNKLCKKSLYKKTTFRPVNIFECETNV